MFPKVASLRDLHVTISDECSVSACGAERDRYANADAKRERSRPVALRRRAGRGAAALRRGTGRNRRTGRVIHTPDFVFAFPLRQIDLTTNVPKKVEHEGPP